MALLAGQITAGGRHQQALLDLPASVPELMAAVQGLLIHRDLTGMYDVPRTERHDVTSNLRTVEEILDHLLADGRPITQARPPAERVAGTCRDFTVLTVAALRAHGVPARARCGFGAYFPSDAMEDHWVAEYWDGRWVLADAQLDDRQRAAWSIGFDTADVPRDQFVVAGQAWRRCRSGADDPGRYGLSPLGEFGDWWIAANLVRDVAALAERELLPWDVWGVMPEPNEEITPDLVALFDELAALTADPDSADAARAVHDRDERIRVPATVLNMERGGREETLP
ncbi:transglutaminase-like domain-containing protein [Pseudonocardia sp. CA-107938]|uniref:transglutaminase-like domain-containing protein n=1 Tax=Pseudonocardia sp. CA-107938 TaxID=3240021 RepID=UPI003D8E13E7